MRRSSSWGTGWQRQTLGTLSAAFLLCALILWVAAPATASSRMLLGICLRVGLLLGAIWLALPQLAQIFHRFPKWVWFTLAVAALLLLLTPAVLQMIIPLALIAVVLYYMGFFKNVMRR